MTLTKMNSWCVNLFLGDKTNIVVITVYRLSLFQNLTKPSYILGKKHVKQALHDTYIFVFNVFRLVSFLPVSLNIFCKIDYCKQCFITTTVTININQQLIYFNFSNRDQLHQHRVQQTQVITVQLPPQNNLQ